ncbi:glutamine--tRNA ligase/YqeY domain fusion protein [Mucisphaera sp.]|uniref:glutamine--tRNA ligase/YqeY domain fusion protein n=1 Tax=Mucisphaera sp. TaxID=2913024 RepID=UPI003D097665
MSQTDERSLNFIEQAIEEHNRSGRFGGAVVTRFPPEPNGFLHIGHAKAICIDFGLAAKYGGRCHLRFDDTNPVKEEQAYIDSIKEDVRWLGFEWGEHEYHASDYFEQLYAWAERLIEAGKAYVDDLSMDEIRAHRGTLTEPGRPSPFRDRPVEENLDLFRRMKAGEFENGARVLRAKIDMASPNLNLRDPVMYRILHATHPRVGDAWCIYPMYDWAHGQSDSIEGITHSLCSLEFEAHRPLYDWFVEQLGIHAPQQMEFARGNITYMITSKRKLLRLIEEGYVSGWDDPRMPTLRGMRRRGYTAAAIRRFWDEAGVAKRVNNIAFSKLESVLRDDLNQRALRRMAVLDPIKVTITNYPEDRVEMMAVVNNPEDEGAGVREVPFSRELYIEREDFLEDPPPPKKFFRLGPGREVRLRGAYWVRCEDYKKDASGRVTELLCTYDPETRGGENPPPDAEGKVRKVRGTLHWVSAAHAVEAEVRVYDHLFTKENPEDGELANNINPDSLKTLTGCKLEPALAEAVVGEAVQFERLGYFTLDPDTADGALVFNRTATLKDTWAKVQQKG